MIYAWFPAGERPSLPVTGAWESIKLLGAVSDTGESFFLPCEENFTSDTTIRLLDALQTEFGEKICVVLDNASYFTANAVHEFVEETPIELCYLPRGSPELNPAEECWKKLNQALGNRLFDTLDDLRDAALAALDSINPPNLFYVSMSVSISSWIVVPRGIVVSWKRLHISRIDTIGHVEQAAGGGLLDEAGEHVLNDVSEVGEKPIDRRHETRSIEPTAKPDGIVAEFAGDRPYAVDVLVVAVQEAAEEFQRFVISCSPPLAGGEHVVLSEKSELKMLEQRERFCSHEVEELVDKSLFLQGLGTGGHSFHSLRIHV